MKIKLKNLKPNPFKKDINKGKLNEDIIEKIKENIKELGLMGALPVFKKEGNYYLIAGHHRVEALKREFGKEYEIECINHNYSDENVLRGMVIENLTQRSDELREVTENLAAVRGFLKKIRSDSERISKTRPHEPGSIRDIYNWLSKNGKVMSYGQINDFLRIHDNLDESLLEKTFKIHNREDKKGRIPIEEARALAKLPKEEQKAMKEILDDVATAYQRKQELVSQYRNADEDIRKQVLKREIGIEEVDGKMIDRSIKKKDVGEKTEFIPNFQSRMHDFTTNVAKLEQQVAIFKKVFRNTNFQNRYNSLGFKEKSLMNTTIYGIRKRIKNCYDEVEFFVEKIETKPEKQRLIK